MAYVGLGSATVEDRQGESVRLLFQPPPALPQRAEFQGLGRGARRRDFLRFRKFLAADAGKRRGQASLRRGLDLLDEFRQDRRSQRQRPAELARLHPRKPTGDEAERPIASRSCPTSGPAEGPRRLLRLAPHARGVRRELSSPANGTGSEP